MSIHSTLLYKQRDKVQIQILRQIATDGKHSKKSLESTLEKHHPVIDNAVNQLLKKELIIRADGDQNNKRGQPEKFYRLTEDGIIILIDEIKIPLNEFWKMLFRIFDLDGNFYADEYIDPKGKLVEENHLVLKNLTIDKLVKKYESSVLGYKRERVIPNVYPKTSDIKLITNCKLTSSEKSIIETLALYDSLSMTELSTKLSKRIIKIPQRLFNLYFIVKDLDTEKYEITVLGIQYLVFIVFKQLKHDKQMQKITILLKNQKSVLPLIFKKWKWLTRYFSNRELFNALIDTIDTNQRQLPFQTNFGAQEILDSHKNLEAVCKSKIKHEYEVGYEIYSEIRSEKIINVNAFRSKTTKNIDNFLKYASITNDPNSKNHIRNVDKSLQLATTELNKLRILTEIDSIGDSAPDEIKQHHRKEYEQNKTDSLSFRFYSILLSKIYQKNEKDFKLDEFIETDKDSKWADFLKTDKDIMPWYSNWIDEIDGFEQKNIYHRKNLVNIF